MGLHCQGYAWEITTSEGGWGLHEVLQSRQDKLNGIVNGIDMTEWDPAHDPDTEAAYSIDDFSGECMGKFEHEYVHCCDYDHDV